MPKKSIKQVFDDCYIQHRMEIMTKGSSLALYVTIPKALAENDYDITVNDEQCMTQFANLLEARLHHWATRGKDPRFQVSEVINDLQNAGLLIRRRA